MTIEGYIARVTDGPGGQRVVFRYKNTIHEFDHISFFFEKPADFKVGDYAKVTLEKAELPEDYSGWYSSEGRI